MINSKAIIENEIKACVESLERMWEIGVIRSPEGRVISTADFVSELFSKGAQAAVHCLPFMAGADEFRLKEKEREVFLQSINGPDSICDGYYHALESFDRQLGRTRNTVLKQLSLEPAIEHYLSYSGLEKTYPRDFSTFMELRDLDYDASHHVSEQKRLLEQDAYTGLTPIDVDYHISTTNCLNSIGNLLSRGDSLPRIFVQSILTHALQSQMYCNEQELKQEILSIDMKQPFINKNVELPGKWATIAHEVSDLPKRDVYKLPVEREPLKFADKAEIITADQTENKKLQDQKVKELSSKILGPSI